jgi:hypothetical protein
MGANDMANALKHPHPELLFTQVGDGRIALAQLAIFSKKVSKTISARTYSSTSQGRCRKTACTIGPSNFNFHHAEQVSEKVTNSKETSVKHTVFLMSQE